MRDYAESAETFYGPVQIEKVVIGSNDSLALINHSMNLSEQSGDNGLEMAIGQEKWRRITGIPDDRHPALYRPSKADERSSNSLDSLYPVLGGLGINHLAKAVLNWQ